MNKSANVCALRGQRLIDDAGNSQGLEAWVRFSSTLFVPFAIARN